MIIMMIQLRASRKWALEILRCCCFFVFGSVVVLFHVVVAVSFVAPWVGLAQEASWRYRSSNKKNLINRAYIDWKWRNGMAWAQLWGASTRSTKNWEEGEREWDAEKMGARNNGVLCTHTVHEIANSERQEISSKWAGDELYNGHTIHSHSAANAKIVDDERTTEKKERKCLFKTRSQQGMEWLTSLTATLRFYAAASLLLLERRAEVM